MLQGEVEVRHIRSEDRFDQLGGQIGGVQVEQPHPRHEPARRLHERDEPAFAATPVAAVGRQILRDQHDLGHTQYFDLGQDRLDGARALLPSETGDGAVAAFPVATLGDLHIGPRSLRRWAWQVQQIHARHRRSGGLHLEAAAGAPGWPQSDRLAEARDGIDRGTLLPQLIPGALRQAARHDELGSRAASRRQAVDDLQ